MTKLVSGALLATSLLLTGAGCIISSDDDDDLGDDGGDDLPDGFLFQPTWECPPQAEDITFIATPVGGGASFMNTFDCGLGGVNNLRYNAGDYDLDIVPEGSIGPFLAQTDTLDADDGDLIQAEYLFPQDGGFFRIAWTIDGEDADLSCAEVGAEAVAVDATFLGDPDLELVDEFPCEDGFGITDIDAEGWPIGEYVLDVSLIEEGTGDAISAPEPLAEVFIEFAGELVDLDDVDLEPL